MDIASMNVQITFQKNEVQTDEIGNRTNAWEDYYSCHASVSGENGSKSSELTVPGEDATSYMQLWVHIDTGENSSGYYDSDGKEFELPCLNSLQPSFFEIELKYQDGSQSIKQYSIFPDKLNASGNLESIIIAEG